MTVDWVHTPAADAARAVKARRIAAWCWDHGVTTVDVRWAPARVLAAAARAADVNPPSTQETWARVIDLLAQKTAWAASHPGHPAAARPRLRACCTCRPMPCAAGVKGACRGCTACETGCLTGAESQWCCLRGATK